MLYVPYAAMAAAFVLIHLPRQLVSIEMSRLAGGYNNHDPRGQQQHLEGRGKRALGAHQNGFEAFAPFAAAVLAAMQRHARLDLIAYLSIAFVVFRSIYVAAYLADRATLRSSVWTLGLLATLGLFALAIGG